MIHARISIVLLAALLFTYCQKEPLDDVPIPDTNFQKSNVQSGLLPHAISAEAYNDLFTQYGGGWTGGDVARSLPLPDGRMLWSFGDTFLDTVYADRSRPFSPLIRNSFVIQDGENLTTLHGGTVESPEAYIDSPHPNEWYWPGHGLVYGGSVYITLRRFAPQGSGAFGFKYKGADLARLNAASLEVESIIPISSNQNILIGAHMMEEDGYIYIYSTETVGIGKRALLFRIAPNNPGNAEFYSGEGWTQQTAGYAHLQQGNGTPLLVSNAFSIFKAYGKYRLLTHADFFSDKIFIYQANDPWGPWTHKTLVYETPESGPLAWTYNAVSHPHIQGPGQSILVSYCVNSTYFSDLFNNADLYRPYFFWLSASVQAS